MWHVWRIRLSLPFLIKDTDKYRYSSSSRNIIYVCKIRFDGDANRKGSVKEIEQWPLAFSPYNQQFTVPQNVSLVKDIAIFWKKFKKLTLSLWLFFKFLDRYNCVLLAQPISPSVCVCASIMIIITTLQKGHPCLHWNSDPRAPARSSLVVFCISEKSLIVVPNWGMRPTPPREPSGFWLRPSTIQQHKFLIPNQSLSHDVNR